MPNVEGEATPLPPHLNTLPVTLSSYLQSIKSLPPPPPKKKRRRKEEEKRGLCASSGLRKRFRGLRALHFVFKMTNIDGSTLGAGLG
jgi:hypothetical protein